MKGLTTKQLSILTTVLKGNTDGSHTDLDECLERLDYETSKQSLQFSIRALIVHGYIKKAGTEKRRGRRRGLLSLTEVGEMIMGKQKAKNTRSEVFEQEGIVLEEPVELGTEVL